MGKHELALQHAMKALILIQDELVSKFTGNQSNDLIIADSSTNQATQQKRPEDRLIVLCIAYHNIAVEQEFLK
jgi:hypothetical protein